MDKPRFNIGDVVFNKVARKGCYEPSTCFPNTKLTVDKIERSPKGVFIYTCDYDGYEFKEDELMSPEEYAKEIFK